MAAGRPLRQRAGGLPAGPTLAYLAAGVALWPLPVVGALHAEGAAVMAAVAFFVSGLHAAGQLPGTQSAAAPVEAARRLREVLWLHVCLLALPAAMLAATLLWRPNAGVSLGVLLFAVLTVPSAVLGVALAWAGRGWLSVRATRWAVGVLGVAVAVGGVVWDLGFHPQLFTYNHVFGGVLGPIYDQELAVRPGLFAFRGLTILWATALALLGHVRRGGPGRGVLAATCAVLAGAYAAAVPLGVWQSPAALQRALGATAEVVVGERVAYWVHYDPQALPPARLRDVRSDLLWHEARIAARLGVRPSAPVHVYLYPDADTKGALIGSRETSVVPVWLATPQMHLLQDQVGASLGHELVHVVARELAPPPLRAPVAVGLIEGVAVALEPPDGAPSPEQTAAAGRVLDDAGGLDDPAAVAAGVLSPVGFWTRRAGVAYTTSGAFVGWLLDTYGAAPFRAAYGSGRIAAAYGVPADSLAAGWARHLAGVRVGEEALAFAAWRLRQPSLFEVASPHYVPPAERFARRGWDALDAGQADRAARLFRAALGLDARLETAAVGYARARMAESTASIEPADLVWIRTDSLSSPAVFVALGDALALLGRSGADAYREAETRMPPGAVERRELLRLRRRLTRDELADLVATPARPQSAAARLEADMPLFAALLWAEAARPDRAWRAARRLCVGPESGPADLDARAAVLGITARLALRAGAYRAARLRAAAGARAAEGLGRDALVRLYTSLAGRARWSQRQASRVRRDAPDAVRPASIFDPLLPPADAFSSPDLGTPECAAPTPRRAPRRGGDRRLLRPAR